MIGTVMRIGLINLKRDRVALLMTFVLPVVFFSIFASIFAGSSGGDLPRVHLAVVDLDKTEASARFVKAIQAEPSFRGKGDSPSPDVVDDVEQARALVREGKYEAAVVLQEGFAESFGSFMGSSGGAGVSLIVDDVANAVASQMVSGLLQKLAMSAAPDLMIEHGVEMFEQFGGPLTDAQRSSLNQYLPMLKRDAQGDGANASASDATDGETSSAGFTGPVQVTIEPVQVSQDGDEKLVVSFYAAGIGVMFLLFSMAGAMGALLQEASTGTLERLLLSRLGMSGLLYGNWVFATIVGCVQLSVMFFWGWLIFGVDLFTVNHFAGFGVMTLVSASCAAAFGLMLGTVCRSQGQMQGISTTVIMVMSAVGGSMFPRFLMPESLRRIGNYTFNGQALDGYQKVFWYDAQLWQLWPHVAALGGMTMVFLILARFFARRWESA